ncbi:PP2C family protein-serine/threonine phosphatase [Streptomyces sp. 549]|uniref:PP2C family protein-serine/threonine phosphatase n=1 Tax=Streptomyces sp. 549 TaxID=3049076 RepID=UPI0024C2A78E|nr:PP2C family protein-serine/threonine phosphatase [Streptomyces sp. 549]MDK1473491.1 PP2C family protein-serine/threonine phosphatase [Streptomyces sp. 549]
MFRNRARRALPYSLPAGWVLAVLLYERLHGEDGLELVQLLAAGPAIACAATGRRLCVVLGGVLCAALLFAPVGPAGTGYDVQTRTATCATVAAVVAASYLTAGRRLRLQRELERIREIATAVQHALLQPPPERIGALRLSAAYVSATRGAALGGDLYEAVSTRFGVRAVIGDVRGHGLPAVGAVAALLGSFREAAHEEPDLAGVLTRMERTADRRRAAAEGGGRAGGQNDGQAGGQGEGEDFVTLLLVEIRADGTASLLNCGHPWPYLLSRGGGGFGVEQVSTAAPLPPMGVLPLPRHLPQLRLRLNPGDTLFLHTDGAEDARSRDGRPFPLRAALDAAARRPADAVALVRGSLQDHTRGRFTDDVALLGMRYLPADGPPPAVAAAGAGRGNQPYG